MNVVMIVKISLSRFVKIVIELRKLAAFPNADWLPSNRSRAVAQKIPTALAMPRS